MQTVGTGKPTQKRKSNSKGYQEGEKQKNRKENKNNMSISEYNIPTISNSDTSKSKWDQLAEEVETGNYDFEAFKDEENYQNSREVTQDQIQKSRDLQAELAKAKEGFAEEIKQKRGHGLIGFIKRRVA